MKIYKQNPWGQTVSINQLVFSWIHPISHVRAVKFSSQYFYSFCSSCVWSAGTRVQVGRWVCAGASACSARWPPAQRCSRGPRQGHRPATCPARCGSHLGSADHGRAPTHGPWPGSAGLSPSQDTFGHGLLPPCSCHHNTLSLAVSSVTDVFGMEKRPREGVVF